MSLYGLMFIIEYLYETIHHILRNNDELGTAIYNENPNVDYIEIDYIPEENDAIVRIINTGDFIYHDNKRVAKLVSVGSLSEITVY